MIFEKLVELLAEQFSIEASNISMDTSFENDLGADSLDLVELSMALEEEFGMEEMSEEDVANVKTVGDLVRYLQNKIED